jgi:hypothetical protein
MGQNRRYPGHSIDREIEEAVTRPMPIGLTPAEVDLEHHQVIEARDPLPVTAFVRFHEAVIRPDCVAIAWTDRAVKVSWTARSGYTHEVWVWASAVDRRPPRKRS